ncbi:cyclophilin-like fold protein [Winogradskyella forsetii]|uniref:cyclophilin-like fold protein n=1 Tax=Winogradskyella forsetii TaxID=2686077 RepID=UPI0015BC6E0F|nr:cyclophilin-like fold protein [Winogradskyella forsetii]
MKSILTMFAVVFTISFCTKGCSDNRETTQTQNNGNGTYIPSTSKMKITIGSRVFTATLYDNQSATAFKEMLPLTINMTELNGNEKYFDLPENLPANASNPKTIQNGDLMLYGSNTLVLFYKTFSTSYSYTKIGKVDNPEDLQKALGSGNVNVTFELE